MVHACAEAQQAPDDAAEAAGAVGAPGSFCALRNLYAAANLSLVTTVRGRDGCPQQDEGTCCDGG